MSTTLNLSFRLQDGTDSRIAITQPKPSLDAAAIRVQGAAIVTSDVFSVSGSNMAAYKGAQLVEITHTDFA
ncbi:MAG: DUF2922 domain-containing protein [Bacillota bacterium]